MTPAFQPDLFSASTPKWIDAGTQSEDIFRNVLDLLPVSHRVLNCPPEKIDAVEINSSNLRLTSQDGDQILLKRYQGTVDVDHLHKTLGLMDWLESQGLPVPRPLAFSNGSKSIRLGGGYWALFTFVEGEYFSGSESELDAAAHASGVLASKLIDAPLSVRTDLECHQFTDQDAVTMEIVQDKRDDWDTTFGCGIAGLLDGHWDLLWREWLRILKSPVASGPKILAHLDLHPFNILVKDSRVTALLDFDSCKIMRIGHALAFGALKQCRQAVAHRGTPDCAPRIGARYLDVLTKANHHALGLRENFSDLAMAEVFRRIALIFRLNIQHSDRRWNTVLPIQLAHIAECSALFPRDS